MPAELKAEIEALWRSEGARIADPEARLAQVGFIARSDTGQLAGVCTSTVEKGIYNGLLFHAMRVLVASKHRQNLLAFDLLAHLTEYHFDAWQAQDDSGPVGVKVVIQTPIVAERGRIHCARTFQFPVNKYPWTYLLSGFTPDGHPEYCAYFSAAQASPATAPPATDVSVQMLGQGAPDALREQVIALLQQLSPRSAVAQPDFEGRVVYTLHRAGELAALCELVPREVPEINGCLLGMLVHNITDVAGLDTTARFAADIYEQLNAQASSAPFESAGLFMVYNGRTAQPPSCATSGFHLHGVDAQGKELRVRYFDETKVRVPGT